MSLPQNKPLQDNDIQTAKVLNISLPKPTQKSPTPSPESLCIYELYRNGMSPDSIAELKGISYDGVKYHLKRVTSFYKNHWGNNQYLLLQQRLEEKNRLINAAADLVDSKDSRTVNNLLNRTIIPVKQEHKRRITNVNMIAKTINLGVASHDDSPIDACLGSDSECVDAEYDIDTTPLADEVSDEV